MILFRPAQQQDLEKIIQLSEENEVGITSFPKDKALLTERLAWSLRSFSEQPNTMSHHYYWFILEDTENSELLGVSAIETAIGQELPFYSFKITHHTHICHPLSIKTELNMLHLVNDKKNVSELCTLYLNPKYRAMRLGGLLSRARFLFMTHCPERFSETVIADMRGISRESGESPFWSHVGQHFFGLSFQEADQLSLSTDKQFIADLMPQYPIYIELLPKSIQTMIGQTHPNTKPALKMLKSEGFEHLGYIDIFDAGPTLEAPFHSIRSIQERQILQITHLCDEVNAPDYIIANQQTDFRAIQAPLLIQQEKPQCIMTKQAASILGVQCFDSISVIPLSFEAKTS